MADGFIAKAETRAEKLGNSLGMRVTVFYFMPFLITVLWVRMRKYSVILSQLPRPIQLIFTFGVTGSFEDFYRFVPLMDRVIESIRVESNEKTQ